jgi:hypothetical protein
MLDLLREKVTGIISGNLNLSNRLTDCKLLNVHNVLVNRFITIRRECKFHIFMCIVFLMA